MRTTYKLFGTIWDGIDDTNQETITEGNQFVGPTMVSLSSLLSASSEDDVAKILEPFQGSETITIDIDYYFMKDNLVIKTFIRKRERQIKEYLSKKFKAVYFCHNADKKIPSRATNI